MCWGGSTLWSGEGGRVGFRGGADSDGGRQEEGRAGAGSAVVRRPKAQRARGALLSSSCSYSKGKIFPVRKDDPPLLPTRRSSPCPRERGPLQAVDNAVFPCSSASNLDRKVLCFKDRDSLSKRQRSSVSKRRGATCGARAELAAAQRRHGRAPSHQFRRGQGLGAGALQGCRNRRARGLLTQSCSRIFL